MKLQHYIVLISTLVISSAAFSGKLCKTREEWIKLFSEQRKSGLTTNEFCSKKNIKPNTFRHTKSKIKTILTKQNIRLPEAFQPTSKRSKKTQPPPLYNHQNSLILPVNTFLYTPLVVFFPLSQRESLYSKNYNNEAFVATQYWESFMCMCEHCRCIRNNTASRTTTSPENGNTSEPAQDNPLSISNTLNHHSNTQFSYHKEGCSIGPVTNWTYSQSSNVN